MKFFYGVLFLLVLTGCAKPVEKEEPKMVVVDCDVLYRLLRSCFWLLLGSALIGTAVLIKEFSR